MTSPKNRFLHGIVKPPEISDLENSAVKFTSVFHEEVKLRSSTLLCPSDMWGYRFCRILSDIVISTEYMHNNYIPESLLPLENR